MDWQTKCDLSLDLAVGWKRLIRWFGIKEVLCARRPLSDPVDYVYGPTLAKLRLIVLVWSITRDWFGSAVLLSCRYSKFRRLIKTYTIHKQLFWHYYALSKLSHSSSRQPHPLFSVTVESDSGGSSHCSLATPSRPHQRAGPLTHSRSKLFILVRDQFFFLFLR